jgi:hypothetical protein
LDALKAGEAVVVGSDMLLCAFVDADLPRASYDRFCFGGTDFKKSLVLSERDGLTPYVEWEPGRCPEPVDGLGSRLITNRRRFLSRRQHTAGVDEYLDALESQTPVAVRGWELRAGPWSVMTGSMFSKPTMGCGSSCTGLTTPSSRPGRRSAPCRRTVRRHSDHRGAAEEHRHSKLLKITFSLAF